MALNGISSLSTKEAKQVAKLDIAEAKRQGKTVAGDGTISGAVDANQPYYRVNNIYDITELPTRYSGNTVVDNPNSEGLLQGRPWSSDGVTLPVTMWLDPAYAVSGATIPDQSTNSNDATLVGATHDADNDQFTFDGTNDYIRSPNLYSDIGNPDTFSAGAWVKPTAGGVVMAVTNTATPGVAYHFSALEFVESGGKPVPYFGLWNGLDITSDTGTALEYDTWYHMMLTYNGTTLKGYINGAEVASASVTFDSPHDDGETDHYLLWGASDATNMGDGTYFNGNMGEIRAYDDAITADQVLSNYNATKSRYGY